MAIVDDGLLDLTCFKTPIRMKHFMREALGVKVLTCTIMLLVHGAET